MDSSDLSGPVTSDNTTNQLTLELGNATWRDDAELFTVTVGGVEYAVASRISDTVIEVSDPMNVLVTGSGLSWEMKGYPSDEIVEVEGISLVYEVASDSHVTAEGPG